MLAKKAHGTYRLIAPAAISACLMSSGVCAIAQVTTDTLDVQITIVDECTLGSIGGINFGSTGLIGADIDQQGTISVTCTDGTPYTVSLDEGGGTGATEASRLMTRSAGSETVAYILSRNIGHTLLWGTGPNAYSGVGSGTEQVLDVFGRVPIQTTPVAGTYQDTVTVTLTF